MITAATVLLLMSVVCWLALREYPQLLGIVIPCRCLKQRYLKPVLVLGIAGSMLVNPLFIPREALQSSSEMLQRDNLHLITIVLTALISAILLYRFSLVPSFFAALIGGLEGDRLLSDANYTFDPATLYLWVGAIAASFLLTAILYSLLRSISRRSNIHLIQLSHTLRYIVIAAIVLGSLAVGYNQAPLFGEIAKPIFSPFGWASVVTALVLAFFSRRVIINSNLTEQRSYSISMECAVAAGLSIPIVLLLIPTPVSLPPLAIASLLGASAVRRSYCVERKIVWRTAAGLVFSPLLAASLTIIISNIFKLHNGGSYPLAIVAGVVVIGIILTIFYIRSLRIRRERTEARLDTQQQQLYENQKALNSLEVKSMLSENRHLQNTLELKRKELIDVALSIGEQKEYLEKITERLEKITLCKDEQERSRLLSELTTELRCRTQNDTRIEEFYAQAELVHKDFSLRLEESFPNLTMQEKKLATLLRLGFSSKYIAQLMYITPKSVEIGRYRLRQKLGLQRNDNLITFIKSI